MLEANTLILFLGAALALSLAPGPDNIFVLTQSAVMGRKAGVLVTLGLCTGVLVHTVAVAFGVAVIFSTSALAFTVLKMGGAAYLLFLAWQAFRAGQTELAGQSNAALSSWQLYRRGIFMNVANPKVAIFFLAFLPQFVAPDRGPLALQIIALGLIFVAATVSVFTMIALCAAMIGDWLRKSNRAQSTLNYLAATVFAGLAIKLVFSDRSV